MGTVPLRSLLFITLVGGAIGAILLLSTPVETFDRVLPWLLLLAALALGFGPRLGDWLGRRSRITPAAVLTVQFALAIYGGYFGGAVGIMMMAVWGLPENGDLKSLNAPRTLLVAAANMMAVLTFVVAQAVQWRETAVMLTAAVLGGYGGAQIGRRASAAAVRVGTLLLTIAITLAFFARAYLRTPAG